MDPEFIAFCKFEADDVQIFVEYSYGMDNRQNVFGGGASWFEFL